MNGETTRPERLSVEQIRRIRGLGLIDGDDALVVVADSALAAEAEVERLREIADATLVVECTDPEHEERDRLAAENARLREALCPFVEFHNRSMAARNPRMSDDLGVATIQNNIEGDISITVGHLRAAAAVLAADEGGE